MFPLIYFSRGSSSFVGHFTVFPGATTGTYRVEPCTGTGSPVPGPPAGPEKCDRKIKSTGYKPAAVISMKYLNKY